MKKNHWNQLPYCTTLMGCLKGVYGHYGINHTPAMLYGLTGHAFFINIHEEVCPSGPYAWDHGFFFGLSENLGVKITESPFMTQDTPEAVRNEGVNRLKSFLEGDNPCMATCLEHQLVKEIKGEEIRLIKPWEDPAESQFASINIRDLSPCLQKAGFLLFGFFEKVPVTDNPEKAVHRALLAADDLYRNPEKYNHDRYQTGFGAYEYWISALQKNEFDPHGHWWNGMVWSECRDMASRFFEELAGRNRNMDEQNLKTLASVYRIISDRLSEAKDKDLEREKKIILLTEALEMEYEAHFLIEQLLKD